MTAGQLAGRVVGRTGSTSGANKVSSGSGCGFGRRNSGCCGRSKTLTTRSAGRGRPINSGRWRLCRGSSGVESAAALAREADVPESAVRALVTKGYAAYTHIDVPPPPLPSFAGACPPRRSPPCRPPRRAALGSFRVACGAPDSPLLLPLLCRDFASWAGACWCWCRRARS